MASYPVRGSKPWDTTLKAYIDGLQSGIDSRIEEVIDLNAAPVYSLAKYAKNLGIGNSQGFPTGSPTENFSPALQAMVADYEANGGHGYLRIPGTPTGVKWRLNSTVYMNSPDFGLMYRLVGDGRSSKITLGSGLNGKWAVQVNRRADGTEPSSGPRHPRLVVADLWFDLDADALTAKHFVSMSCAVSFSRVYMNYYSTFYETLSGDYVDNVRFSEVHIFTCTDDAIFYKQRANGDGLIMEQIHAPTYAVVADLNGCAGGLITGAVTGRYIFDRCESITVIGAHFDGKEYAGAPAINPAFVIKNSQVHFLNCWGHGSANGLTEGLIPTMAVYQINDVISGDKGSHVVFDHTAFMYRQDHAAKLRPPDLMLTSVDPTTIIQFRSCDSLSWANVGSGTTNRYRGGGPVISATDATLAAAIVAYGAVLDDSEITYRSNAWSVSALAGIRRIRAQSAPSLTLGASTNWPSSLGDGVTTYYYRVATYNTGGQAISTEQSVLPSVGQAPRLSLANLAGPIMLRVWRGTAAGVYDSYVDLPMNRGGDKLWDAGLSLNGIPWITTAVPAVPSALSLGGEERAGALLLEGAAAPTVARLVGDWPVGAYVRNNTPSIGAPVGWVNRVASPLGTWEVVGDIGWTRYGSGSSSSVDASRAVGDTNTRFNRRADGQMQWGSGSGAVDVTLARTAADQLGVGSGDSFKVDGTFNGGRVIMGAYHLWVDATGRLRIKNGAPTTDTDGTVVGTQT